MTLAIFILCQLVFVGRINHNFSKNAIYRQSDVYVAQCFIRAYYFHKG